MGSNVSTWHGPPLAKMWMTRLALAAKCGFFGASGFGDRLGGEQSGLVEQAGQAKSAEAEAAAAKEVAAGRCCKRLKLVHIEARGLFLKEP